MKNSKFTKILTLTLAAALLVAMALAFGVSAEEATATDPALAIAGKNVVYDETLTIQYAVSTSNISSDAQLVVSNSVASGFTTASGTETTDKITGTSDEYYVFEVTDIPASDVCEEITVYIKDGEKVGPEFKYSLAEYFYERLFDDDVINPDDDTETYQKALYLSYLEYAANAQAFFRNFKKGENVTLVTDRHYVNIAGGTVNGAESGVYLPGTELTLAAAEGTTVTGWNVTTYTVDADGNTTSNTVYKKDGATITLPAASENITATLIAEGEYVGEYFAQYGGLDYEGVTKVTGLNQKVFAKNNYVLFDDITYQATSNRAWLRVVSEEDGNTALEFRTQSKAPKDSSSNPLPGYVGITTDTASGNCLVFETDIKIDASRAQYIYDNYYSNKTDGSWMISFNAGKEGTTSSSSYSSGSTYSSAIGYLTIDTNDGGETYHYHLGYGEGALYGGPEITANEWHNIRIEYYSTGKIALYVDGVYIIARSATVVGDTFGDSIDNLTYDAIAMYYREASTNSVVLFDNTVVTVVEKTAP